MTIKTQQFQCTLNIKGFPSFPITTVANITAGGFAQINGCAFCNNNAYGTIAILGENMDFLVIRLTWKDGDGLDGTENTKST